MKEIWKKINGYEGIYEISNLGRIKSVPRTHYMGNNRQRVIRERIRKFMAYAGYWRVNLNKNGVQKNYKVSRLVAQTFLPNYENKPCVNHKNGIKKDNRVENLEWATIAENNLHAYVTGLKHNTQRQKDAASITAKAKRKPVLMYTLEGKFIKRFNSVKSAQEETKSWPSKVLRGLKKSTHGYVFKYEECT